MNWTTDTPTTSGFYWVNVGSWVRIVEVDLGTGATGSPARVWDLGYDCPLLLDLFAGLPWAGPILPPTDHSMSRPWPVIKSIG